MSREQLCREQLCIDADLAGQRLDRALAALTPQLGQRGRRRLLEQGLVLLNGQRARPAQKVRCGDILSLTAAGRSPVETYSGEEPRFLGRDADHAYFYKPAGLHTVALSGGGASLEDFLPQLLARHLPQIDAAQVQLLQRLDCGTSGLVCAALSAEAAQAFRRAEPAGRCEKRYVALLCGRLDRPCTARQSLNTSHRQRTRVLSTEAQSLRWTSFYPLAHLTVEELSALRASRQERAVSQAQEGQTADRHAETGSSADLDRLQPAPETLHEDSERLQDAPHRLAQAGGRPPQAADSSVLGAVSPWLQAGECAAAGVQSCGLTLAGCSIRCGARHQIRAHAAALGHPLWGDRLYTLAEGQGLDFSARATAPLQDAGEAVFFLHHGALQFPAGSRLLLPPWPLTDIRAEAVRKWLESGLICGI